jgi:glycosyltransferase involved in cell wall biosynthesis
MKIVVCFPSSGFGGAELHDLALAQRLQSDGHEVLLVYELSEGVQELERRAAEAGLPTRHALVAWRESRFPNEVFDKQRHAFGAVLRGEQADVALISCPWPPAAIGLMAACNHAQLAAVYVFHLARENLPQTALAAATFKQACVVPWVRFVAVSAHTADLVAGFFGTAAATFDVIDNSVDVPVEILAMPREQRRAVALQVRKELGLHADERIVLTVGRLDHQKGFTDLLDVVPAVTRLRPDVHFVWLGEGPLRQDLRAGLVKRQVGSFVSMPGHQSDVYRYFLAADVFLFPTHYEGFSLTLCEAIILGLPIVCTQSPGSGSLFENGVDALLCDVADTAALARATLALIDDPWQAETLRSGLNRLQLRLSYQDMYAAYLGALRNAHAAAQLPPEGLPPDRVLGGEHLPESVRRVWGGAATRMAVDGAAAVSVRSNDAQRLALSPLFTSDSAGLDLVLDVLEDPLVGELQVFPADATVPVGFAGTGAETVYRLFAARRLVPVVLQGHGATRKRPLALQALLVSPVGRAAIQAAFIDRATPQPLEHAWLALLEAGLRRDGGLVTAGLVRELKLSVADTDFVRALAGVAAAHRSRDILEALGEALAQRTDTQALEIQAQLTRTRELLPVADAITTALKMDRHVQSYVAPRRVLFAFHRVPFPAQMGSDLRAHSMLMLLRRLGYQCVLVTLSKPEHLAETRAKASQYLLRFGVMVDITVLTADEAARDTRPVKGEIRWDEYYYPSLHARMVRLAAHFEPELVYVNYAQFGYLSTAITDLGFTRVIDTHDVITARESMLHRLETAVGGMDGMLRNDISRTFDCEYFQYDGGEGSHHEALIYGAHDVAIAISRRDQDVIAQIAPGTQAVYVPFVPEPVIPCEPRLAQDRFRVLFIGGDNLLNRHAAIFIQRHLAPHLTALYPDIEFQIVGSVCKGLPDTRGVAKLGFVDDLGTLYRGASVVICPLFWASGQNIKVVEALSYGLPVVTTPPVAERAQVRHQHNGMVAATQAEFVDALKSVYRDPALRRRLSIEARHTVASSFSAERAMAALQSALSLCERACP